MTFGWDNLHLEWLFLISQQKYKSVAECGHWCERGWVWDLQWRRELFEWEKVLLEELRLVLQQANLAMDRNDVWIWGVDATGSFTTKSAYKVLETQTMQTQIQSIKSSGIFNLLWKCKIPTKVLAFT